MKQLHKTEYHDGNLEAIKVAGMSLQPNKWRQICVEAADFLCLCKFIDGDQQTQILWLARDRNFVRQMVSAVLPKIQVFWDLTLCCLASS